MITCSRRSLHYACFAWLPMIGFAFGALAVSLSVRANWYRRSLWNPVAWQATLGGAIGLMGFMISLALVLGNAVDPDSYPTLMFYSHAIGILCLLAFFGTGLWLIAQLTRLPIPLQPWKHILLVGTTMILWTLVYFAGLGALDKSLMNPTTIAYCLLVIAPLFVLAVGVVSKPVNEFLHRFPVVPILCGCWGWALVALGASSPQVMGFLTDLDIYDALFPLGIIILTIMVFNLIERSLRPRVNLLKRIQSSDPLLYAAYILAANFLISSATLLVVSSFQ